MKYTAKSKDLEHVTTSEFFILFYFIILQFNFLNILQLTQKLKNIIIRDFSTTTEFLIFKTSFFVFLNLFLISTTVELREKSFFLVVFFPHFSSKMKTTVRRCSKFCVSETTCSHRRRNKNSLPMITSTKVKLEDNVVSRNFHRGCS